MLGRRFLLLVAVLMGLTALAASLAPRDPTTRTTETERRATPPAATPPEAEPAAPTVAALTTVEHTISADADRPTRVSVTEGELVRIVVESSELGSVELLNRIETLDQNSPAVFHLLADEPGSHPITLLEADRQIGTLAVRPPES